jgi:hypothetical protein
MTEVDKERRATGPTELPKIVAGPQTQPVLISAVPISLNSSTRNDEKTTRLVPQTVHTKATKKTTLYCYRLIQCA